MGNILEVKDGEYSGEYNCESHAICIKFDSNRVPILYDPGKVKPKPLFASRSAMEEEDPKEIINAVSIYVDSLIGCFSIYDISVTF